MLTIAFLFTFCGLLMAENLPDNQYVAAINCAAMNKAVNEKIPSGYVVPPLPETVTDPTSGDTLTNVHQTDPPKVQTDLSTEPNGYINAACTGAGKYATDVAGSQSKSGVGYDTLTVITVPNIPIENTPDGNLQCGTMPPPDQVDVSCQTKQNNLSGLLGQLLGTLLSIIESLLSLVNNLVNQLLNKTVPDLLSSLKNALNSVLGSLTEPKPMPDGSFCKQKIKKVETDNNNYMHLVFESYNTKADEPIPAPPSTTYPAPDIIPKPDSACTVAVPASLIKTAVDKYKYTFLTLTSNLESLAAKILQLPGCGKNVILTKLVFMPGGKHDVTVTASEITANLRGTLNVFAQGSDVPFLTASGYISFTGTFSYVGNCYTLNIVYNGKGSASFVAGQKECDVTYQALQTFSGELKGKINLSVCVEPSPVAKWQLKGPTMFTLKDGCVIADHKM